MAVTANQIIKAQRRDGGLRSVPVAASTTIYAGTLVYEDAGGDAIGAIVDETTSFLGVAAEYCDNSSGADGDKFVDVYTDGAFVLAMDTTSLAKADLGKTVFGVDNFAVTETATDAPAVGIVTKFLTTSTAEVEIKGIGQGELTHPTSS